MGEEGITQMKRNVVFGFLFFSMLLSIPAHSQGPTTAPAGQLGAASTTEFKRLVAQLRERRAASSERTDDEAARLQESALLILDGIVLENLNATDGPQLDSLNLGLTGIVEPSASVGQSYTVASLGGIPARYALAANFGSSGPSAVRLYAGDPQHFRMAARIDTVTQPDFFDDHLVLVPVRASAGGSEVVFVTVTGRTDEYLTGVFAAWRFASDQVDELWATDLMPHSSYQATPDGIEITYCSEAEEDDPQGCRGMARERYAWDGAAWKRIEQLDLGPPKP